MKQPVERRLAAILAADVAGYSRLMGADEEGTLERLKGLRRKLLDPQIAEHHGRILGSSPGTKTTGVGTLEVTTPRTIPWHCSDTNLCISPIGCPFSFFDPGHGTVLPW